jgi:hypothetical protein
MKKKPIKKPNYTNSVWGKIKKVLHTKGIKDKDKIFYKEKLGFDLIDKNK